MQRFALILFAATILALLTSMLLARLGKSFERHGGTAALTTGGAMQKLAFFLLLCLIVYVSFSGAA